jgi:hypothetical protein
VSTANRVSRSPCFTVGGISTPALHEGEQLRDIVHIREGNSMLNQKSFNGFFRRLLRVKTQILQINSRSL